MSFLFGWPSSRYVKNDVDYAAADRRHLDAFMTIMRRNKAVTEYRFGNCRLVVPSREIWRDDELIAAEPKVFDLLLFLIRNRDRAVDKNELQDEVWSGTIVTEASVTRCIMKARRAIGSDAEAITTVRGHGYRFAIDATEISGSGSQSPLSIPDKPSLVVLPFVNLSSDPEQEYFSDGITEDIITELSRFRSLFVIGRQSAFSFKGRNLSTREIAEELGVAYVVDGSLRRAGERIRITVRLVNAANDAQLWAERYDRDLEDVLVVQEEVATTVAATIGGRVEATRGRQRIDGAALESYDSLLRAQALYYDYSMDANSQARDLLERAIDADPDNARALAILAAVHSMDSWSFWVDDVEASRRLSLELAKKSIEIDDSDSLAHALFGEILHDCGQQQLAAHHFNRALDLNPSDTASQSLFALYLHLESRFDDAIKHLHIAKRLDPFSLNWIPVIEGSVMLGAKRYEDAVSAISRMVSPPCEARCTLIAALGHLGRVEEAIQVRSELLKRARNEMPNYPGEILDDWKPVFQRMLTYSDRAELDRIFEGLRLAGWQ
ncbi:MAG: winged helix-turn-helix domain-containing protein [Woeseiaceae bacterium]